MKTFSVVKISIHEGFWDLTWGCHRTKVLIIHFSCKRKGRFQKIERQELNNILNEPSLDTSLQSRHFK